MSTKALGDAGEQLAADHLTAAGWTVLDRNYRFERCEIDLVCFEPFPDFDEGGEIVFVEVKARRSLRFGAPEEAVTPAKQRLLVRAAEAYLYERRLTNARCRFDVVSIHYAGARPTLRHFRHAFLAE